MSPTSSVGSISRSMANIVKLIYNKSGQINLGQYELACEYLTKKGGVVILPTDTLYGLAARVEDSDAIERIYSIKGRDRNKPLAVCLGSLDDVANVAEKEGLDQRLLPSLLPGPVTVLLRRKENLNHKLNPGHDVIGVRVPDHNFITAICNTIGPLALTSANKSGESSPIESTDLEELSNDVDCIFDQGTLQKLVPDANVMRIQRLGSTVIDLTRTRYYTIVREGCAFHRSETVLQRFGYRKSKDISSKCV